MLGLILMALLKYVDYVVIFGFKKLETLIREYHSSVSLGLPLYIFITLSLRSSMSSLFSS